MLVTLIEGRLRAANRNSNKLYRFYPLILSGDGGEDIRLNSSSAPKKRG